MLAPHEQRVVDELAELEERIKKLQSFIRTKGSAFHSLPKIDQDLLTKQLSIQLKLAEVLETRIKRFKYPNVDVKAIETEWHSQTLKDLMSFSKGDVLVFVRESDAYLPCYAHVKVTEDAYVSKLTSDPYVAVEYKGVEYRHAAACFVKANYG